MPSTPRMHAGLDLMRSRAWPAAANPLLQGPGLLVVNDGKFRKEDQRGIRLMPARCINRHRQRRHREVRFWPQKAVFVNGGWNQLLRSRSDGAIQSRRRKNAPDHGPLSVASEAQEMYGDGALCGGSTARAGRSLRPTGATEVAPARHGEKPQNDLTLAAPPSIAGPSPSGPAGKAWPGENVDEPELPAFSTGPSTATFFSKSIGQPVLLGHFD